jgi:hypothetical protein
VDAFRESGIDAYVIGKMMPSSCGVKMQTLAGLTDLPAFPRDEIARFFDER